jgi:hypothetical protein
MRTKCPGLRAFTKRRLQTRVGRRANFQAEVPDRASVEPGIPTLCTALVILCPAWMVRGWFDHRNDAPTAIGYGVAACAPAPRLIPLFAFHAARSPAGGPVLVIAEQLGVSRPTLHRLLAEQANG